MIKTVEFTHTRTPSSTQRLAQAVRDHRTEKDIAAEKFAGHIIATGYAFIVSLFDGEQEHYFISSSMQSGNTEIAMARADVDGGVTIRKCDIRSVDFHAQFQDWMKDFPLEVAENMQPLIPDWWEYLK